MTADRREFFIESSQFVCLSFARWTRKVQMALREDICENSAPHRAGASATFKTGSLSINPKRTNDALIRDGREQTPYLILQRPDSFHVVRAPIVGMVLVDRSSAHAHGNRIV